MANLEFTPDDFHDAADAISKADDHHAMRAAYDFVQGSEFSGAEMDPISLGYGILIGIAAMERKLAKQDG